MEASLTQLGQCPVPSPLPRAEVISTACEAALADSHLPPAPQVLVAVSLVVAFTVAASMLL